MRYRVIIPPATDRLQAMIRDVAEARQLAVQASTLESSLNGPRTAPITVAKGLDRASAEALAGEFRERGLVAATFVDVPMLLALRAQRYSTDRATRVATPMLYLLAAAMLGAGHFAPSPLLARPAVIGGIVFLVALELLSIGVWARPALLEN